MKVCFTLIFFCILGSFLKPVLGIVPKPGVPLENYAVPAKNMNNIGRLMVHGKKTSSCSSALIGIDGDIGIVLTAGHCAELSKEEEVKKCRFQTVSFAADNTYDDPQQLPIIGRAIIGNYVEKPGSFIADIGIVFVDFRDSKVIASPLTIELDPDNVPKKTLVQIVGYGKTSENDKLKNPQRLVMSTEAVRSKEHGHDVLWLDETEIETQSLEAPVGDHPAEGDSGGATINMDTGEIIGVVSHSTNHQDYYSEPLYPHAEWLMAQIKNARRYLVFKPNRSGKFSDTSIWSNNRRLPMSFKNPYGEINPIVEIDSKTAVTFDASDSHLYAINVLREGGTLQIETPEQYAEVLRVYAPTVITSPSSGKLIVETVKVNHSDFSLQSQLRILYSLEVKTGVVMDTKTGAPTRGITLVDNGNINIDGTLRTHHINFAPTISTDLYSLRGRLEVFGRLEVDEPMMHLAQEVHGKASTPGEIKADYLLGEKGVLSFNIDTTTPSSTGILKIDGTAKISGGVVSVNSPYVLPLGFEQVLLSANELEVLPSYFGSYNPNMVDASSEVLIVHSNKEVRMKVIPISGKAISPLNLPDLEDEIK